MAKRLTPKNESVMDSELPETPEEQAVPTEELAPDGMPLVYCDVDLDLKRAPNLFKGFPDLDPQEMFAETNDISKSKNDRLWQYRRWRTWKHLTSQPKETIIIHAEGDQDKSRGTASVNGVTYYIVKEIYVDVPKDIAELIRVSQGETAAAGSSELISNIGRKIDPVTGLPKDPNRLE